ncbi:PREDICTED: uncharacterized protein LOC109187040 [Ipomoea nil]|uniref:uncharacterized protein LOC109187040 n=1 Tax=Ipomoea nil TaxID=35883 RepID=UPI0009011C95|nr:PREDICTED: uncharacterized protein LOC109187040 [Ipomoea nil]
MERTLHADVEIVNETPVEEMVQADAGIAPDGHVHTTPSVQAIPPSRRTYAQSVSGQIVPSFQRPGDVKETDPMESFDEQDDDPLCPTIRLTQEELEAIRAPWRKTLIIKVMGRRVGYAYLLRRLQTMWRPKANMDLIAIDNDYFLVRFGAVEDLEFAMFEGPWMIMDHYLIVQPWKPDFDPFADNTEKVLVWARIACLPAEYFNIIFLRKLGNKVGRSIRVDQATSLVSRGMFARICVEVDITKPLISKFNYKGQVRSVAYEGIHMVCFTCGIYGHAAEACPTLHKPEQPPAGNQEGEPVGGSTAANQAEQSRPGVQVGTAPFGAWMIAPGRRPRGKAKLPDKAQKTSTGREQEPRAKHDGQPQASRFAPLVLQDDVGDQNEADHVEEAVEDTGGDDSVVPVDEAGRTSVGEGMAARRGKQVQATGKDKQRRPNVIAREKQIVNAPVTLHRQAPSVAAPSVSVQRSNGGSSRRAAEAPHHVVVRGEQGGLVISSQRVFNGETSGDIPSPVWQPTGEHHDDPPDCLDDEGDIVMDREEVPGQGGAQGAEDAV